ncbi:hypothetical protein FOA52_004429 [Chlamydomonas sp. UWO 241]|nr:hypothetical protein FOA52_004429 [Chlamydomonas sp. UWO 241]
MPAARTAADAERRPHSARGAPWARDEDARPMSASRKAAHQAQMGSNDVFRYRYSHGICPEVYKFSPEGHKLQPSKAAPEAVVVSAKEKFVDSRAEYTCNRVRDVVVVCSSSLAFLDKWRSVLAPYHLIVIQTGSTALTLPPGFDAEIHTAADAHQRLGPNASIVVNANGQLSYVYGYLVSKKQYVYTIGEDVSIAVDPSGKAIDPIAGHLHNLIANSTPLFFNTLYDPYREGADFVRGYPFSLRDGAPTVVSHGLWLNRIDLDTATAMVKPHAKNTRYVDAALTVPKGVMYPMSMVNVAFDRALIGPAMFDGLHADDRPVDDLLTGLCAKVVADHLGLGHKTGCPYVRREDRSAAEAAAGPATMTKDAKVMAFLEELVPFFSSVSLSAASTTADAAYLELADEFRARFGSKDPFFGKLADAMAKWVEVWRACQ